MQEQLSQLYTGCSCHDHTHVATMALTDEWAVELARMVAEIWNTKAMPKQINRAVTELFASQIGKAVEEGFGAALDAIDFDTPDGEMISNLMRNVYQFSAAKNYAQLKALTEAIVDETGRIRTYQDFRRVAFEINDQHVNQWLRTEYDTAIGSAQMARKWVEIQQNKSFAPFLKFDAVMDQRTSEICRPLDGVVKPVTDTFWDVYYPPNHWGCRSTVQQVRSGVITNNHEQPDIQPIFRTNLAKTGSVFPAGHPYFVEAPQHVFDSAAAMYQSKLKKRG